MVGRSLLLRLFAILTFGLASMLGGRGRLGSLVRDELASEYFWTVNFSSVNKGIRKGIICRTIAIVGEAPLLTCT